MIRSRTGWSNLAIAALCAAIACGMSVTLTEDWWRLVLRSMATGGFAWAAVRCTIAAAHAPERRYLR